MNANAVSALRNWGCTEDEITGILRPDEPGADERARIVLSLDDLIAATFDNVENRREFPRLVNHNVGFDGQSLIERLTGADVAEFRRVYGGLGHAFGRW